jgi:hypothetical protein
MTDDEAIKAIEQFDEPVRMALASVIWWDCIPKRHAMKRTFKAAKMHVYPRKFPHSSELIEAMVKIGFSREFATRRIVDEQELAISKENNMRRMRARRAKGLR